MTTSRLEAGLTKEPEREPTGIALLFPGQGLRVKDITGFYNWLKGTNPTALNNYLDITQQAVNDFDGSEPFNIEKTLEDPESPNYQKTFAIQPIIYVLSMAASESIGDEDFDCVAGHSAGEYAAYAKAGVFSPEVGARLITARGGYMQEAANQIESRLVSIDGLTEEQVKTICNNPKTRSGMALFNAPQLIVVGAIKNRVEDIKSTALQMGATNVDELLTAAAFHTPIMDPAAKRMEGEFKKYVFSNPRYRVISNYTGEEAKTGEQCKFNLLLGMTHTVKWTKTLQTVKAIGITTFVEVGPGNSLFSLNNKNGFEKDQTKNVRKLAA